MRDISGSWRGKMKLGYRGGEFEGNNSYTIVVGCAAGLESLVVKEVEVFGGQEIVAGVGVVQWFGTLESAYRCCLWSRFASRVFLELWRFNITDEESLYHASLTAEWTAHLSEDTTFAVSCTLSGQSIITHSRFASLRLKDGLVDQFRSQTGKRPSVKTVRPEVQFHLHIEDNLATISVDLSGESLHRRGYRDATGKAPLKETLGAAIVALCGWMNEPKTLIDPMCGTGTILIEAAMMFGDSAPGLFRKYYGFMGWLGHNDELWSGLVADAQLRHEAAGDKQWPPILGYDCDPSVVRAAQKNVRIAGLERYITITQGEIANLKPPAKQGLVLSNLPYGERLSEKESVRQLYRGYGRILRQHFSGWNVGVFIADPELTDSFAISWKQKHRLFNGSIPCRLLVGCCDALREQEFRWRPEVQAPDASVNEFANRLCKNLKHILKWAEKETVSCFRVYDRDLPDYNVSIDLYGKWVHIQEWAAPKSIDPTIAAERFSCVVAVVKEVLGVRSDRVFIKTRERQKGRSQYEKKGDTKKMYEVKEGEGYYLVNFTDYLDTGLFLDHRPVRERIFTEAAGKRFLNLYGYTGTATVQAALGGAVGTTTVDLSATYLQWARMNLALNGLCEVRNQIEKADCLEWLRSCKVMYDLIFIDPPTFSNTKKEMRVFDVQADHEQLIRLAMSCLDERGLLIFSTNFRRFLMAESLGKQYELVDISRQSLPYDFSRDPKIHKCWEIRHRIESA
jgi:23S rRNA (guanine2445-N2)-methyltransferase / 23S rRNA (guanine2069-N7)-methyltransferase